MRKSESKHHTAVAVDALIRNRLFSTIRPFQKIGHFAISASLENSAILENLAVFKSYATSNSAVFHISGIWENLAVHKFDQQQQQQQLRTILEYRCFLG